MSTSNNAMPYLYALKNDEILSSYYDVWGDEVECRKLQETLNYKGFKEFCVTLTGLLYKLNELPVELLFEKDRCTPIIIWMYENLYKKVDIPNDNVSDSFVIFKLVDLWKKQVADKSCGIYASQYSKDTFQKAKILHDCALDYYNIKNKIQSDGSKCTKTFNQYVKTCVETYKEIKQNCAKKTDMHYCNLFMKINNKFQNPDLSDLLCTEEIPDPVPGEIAFQLEEEDDDYASPEHDAPSGQKIQYTGTEPFFGDSSSSVLDILLPTMGILVTFLILYKFTPFGTLLRGHLIKVKNMRHIPTEHESQELFENEYESMIMDSHFSGHNISYFPS
ncbi:PIR Superfamily Protein [Plasmodium ovale curtisi]|uniref:PIR Superfamily Protein n=1 Tax=Plasmodium ovale curtisi TaxID=864141 RepID=A0A1A8WEN9_PLAOA|nr:PIR Superfamily Protein [Plasmodium ovale curtisi]